MILVNESLVKQTPAKAKKALNKEKFKKPNNQFSKKNFTFGNLKISTLYHICAVRVLVDILKRLKFKHLWSRSWPQEVYSQSLFNLS